MIDDIIAVVVLAVILGGAVAYIVRAKKEGCKMHRLPEWYEMRWKLRRMLRQLRLL